MPAAPRPRRILLVAYYYPPLNIVGARRPSALARHLRALGHEVTVVTSAANGRDVPRGDHVVLTRDLLTTPLNWRRPAPGASADGASVASFSAGTRWDGVFVPDVQLLSWVPFAAATTRRLAATRGADVVITTSPVDSTHLVGLGAGIPWIADFRDGWRFETPRAAFTRRAHQRLDETLERAVVRRADALVTVSEPLSIDLRARHGVAAETIPNGFEPDAPVAPALAPRIRPDGDRLTLVYTGSLGPERHIAPVLEALRRLGDGRAELIVAGRSTEAERALYARPELGGLVRPVGPLGREDSLALQRGADVLVVVTTGWRRSEITGKLPEYLGARRPVLVLGEDSEAARIVTTERAGSAVPVDDVDAVESALRSWLSDGLPEVPAAAGERYAYPTLAARYAEVIERVSGSAA